MEKHSFFNDQDDVCKLSLMNKTTFIRQAYIDDEATVDQMIEALGYLGENAYLDRFIVDLLIKNKNYIFQPKLSQELVNMLFDSKNTSQQLYNLLDICIECDSQLLSGQRLKKVFLQRQKDIECLSMLIEYLTHFSITDFDHILRDSLAHDYPENIKMQIIDWLLNFHMDDEEITELINLKITCEKELKLYSDYLNFIKGGMFSNHVGMVILQTAFFGNPEFSGKGISGGLGTLLRTLGNQLVKNNEVSKVITLTINNDWHDGKPLMSCLAEKHWLIRLPVFINLEDKCVFIRNELKIQRAVTKFLSKWQVIPNVFHIRYLDNASRSIAHLCKEMGAKLVFTLTPDPHRNMVGQTGELTIFKVDEALEKLNKIVIGDEILTISDGLVGIGGIAVRKELEQYFPQLLDSEKGFDLKMMGEGISTELDFVNLDLWEFLKEHAFDFSIDSVFTSRPVILNVGRLNRQKGQDRLIKVWGESKLWKDFNLIVIGGNADKLDDEAVKIMKSFKNYIQANPHLKGRFSHVEALPNPIIRNVERKIMENTFGGYPNIYLCSSLKEEFGISILEALFERFLVFAPIKGGAKTYIENGVNGFLVDTSNWSNLKKDVETVLYESDKTMEDFNEIQKRGRQTVLENFSIEEIVKDLLEFYIELEREV